MEETFYNAMVKVDYANSLNHDDVCKEVGLTSSKIFNNNSLFIAFDKALKRYNKLK